MSYDASRDPAPQRVDGVSARTHGPARNWYPLQTSHIGAKELPAYARCMHIRLAPAFVGSLTMVVVPIAEMDDASTRTQVIDSTNTYTFGVRRIVSLNGGASVPANVSIDLITE